MHHAKQNKLRGGKKLTLDEIRGAMKCLADTTTGNTPGCFTCRNKPLCDDLTRVVFRHKTTEKPMTNAEKQQELWKPTSRYYNF